jgi:excinuclease ABC subunit A
VGQGRRHRPVARSAARPRSNPATYTGLFTPLRELFAQVPEARRARLLAGPFQLQRARRALRGLPGRRPDQGRDALPADVYVPVRRLLRQALQPRDAGDPLQGLQHQRRAGDDRRGCTEPVRGHPFDLAQARNADGRRA